MDRSLGHKIFWVKRAQPRTGHDLDDDLSR